MKKKLLIKGTLLMLLFMMNIGLSAQSFIISFPNFSSGPPLNPQGLTVSNGNSMVQVQLDAAAASTTGASITVQLATGVEYVPGSITTVSSTAGLTISEDGGTANAPKFKIDQSTIALGNRIVFTLRRTATCAARTFLLGGGSFRDTVQGTIAGAPTASENSSTYQVLYPVFSLTQPAAQTNAVLNTNYSRTFTIANGGSGAASAVYFSIDYPAGISQVSLMLGATALTPTSTSGTTSYYTIPSALIPGGALANGQSLIFTEVFKLTKCGVTTAYSAGWGDNATTWCQTVTGTGSVSMVTGVPNFNQFTVAKVGYVNDCTPFALKFTYKNSGTGNVSAAGLYNTVFRAGNGENAAIAAFRFDILNLGAVSINGNVVPHTGGTTNGIYTINVKDAFTFDPDGAGVGLDDLDGDGFYDDLPGGASVVFDIVANVKDNVFSCINTGTVSQYYSLAGDIQYSTMCSNTIITAVKLLDSHWNVDTNTPLSTTFATLFGFSSTSYAPANVVGGTPFRMRFSVGANGIVPINYNANQRFVYEITLPAGLSISGTGNPQWVNGSDINSTTYLTPTSVTQVGNVVTVVSPGTAFGFVSLDLVYTCGTSGSLTVPYKLKYINDYAAGCSSNPDWFCGSYTIPNVICPSSPCVSGGPSITSMKIERADNSLGWSSNALTTRTLRSAISSYNLSKALPLDDIDITANGVQNTVAASNLYLKLGVKKLAGANADKLTPNSIDVVIKRAGSTVASGNVTSFATTGTTSTTQYMTWNLTSILPVGGILPNDVIETVSHYTVSGSASDYPKTDIQTGETISFFNLDGSGNSISCNSYIPEMYLVGFNQEYLTKQNPATACNTVQYHILTANRFNASGATYAGEIRPGFQAKTIQITVPTGYSMVGLKHGNNSQVNATVYLTPTSVSGNVYTYSITPVTENINTVNTYNSMYFLDLAPSCATTSSVSDFGVKIEGQSYYYHYKDLASPNAGTGTLLNTSNQIGNYTISSKPAIALSNQTGNIQASKPTESFTVRMASTGTSTAPYTWISVPTVAGVTVTQILDLPSLAPLTLIPYSGGVWAKISTTGLATGTTHDYRVDFTYTTCNPTTFQVKGGWNCSEYPTDPSTYTCGKSTVDLTFTPQNGAVQIITQTQPTTPINLCTPIDYEFRINSASAGNIVGNKFSITLPQGLNYAGAIQAEYPVGSGNWQTVTQTVAGNVTTLDLTTHTFFPTQGLPGTLTDGGNANSRLMGIKFQVITDCTFVVGSNIAVSTKANKTCGIPAIGDGVELAANSIAVIGANPPYQVVSAVTVPGGFGTCTTPIVANIKHTIITSTSTTATGYAKVYIPTGYTYTAGSFACTSASCPTYAGVFTDPATSEQYLKLNIPGGLPTGTILNYDLGFTPNIPVASGSYTLKIVTVDELAGITCPSAPGGTCSSVLIQTGAQQLDYVLSCVCYDLPNTTTTGPDTKHGITLLQRAGADNGNWPMIRKSAHTVLESNIKGFVITRMTTAEITAIASPQEGMMVYDTVAKCLKLYDGTVWSCFVTPTCP